MPNPRVDGLVARNVNGGFYHPGRMYAYTVKLSIGQAYQTLLNDSYPIRPSNRAVARMAQVSRYYAGQVIEELLETGTLLDPEIIKKARLADRPQIYHLSIEEEMFLLALRTEQPSRPNVSYVIELLNHYGTCVTAQFIGKWFAKRFDYRGVFKKPNLVPLDKFKPENFLRYQEWRLLLAQLPDHTKYHFIDEKHLVNKDVCPNKVRADPLTGYIPCILVNGDFRDSFNLMAVISACPTKPKPVAYRIGRDNGNAAAFLAFINFLLEQDWFQRNDVLIMDNAAIHTGGGRQHRGGSSMACQAGTCSLPAHEVARTEPNRAHFSSPS